MALELSGAVDWASVTPGDTAASNIKQPRAIACTGAGAIVLVSYTGNTWTLQAASDTIYPVRPIRINSTNTTATGIKALY